MIKKILLLVSMTALLSSCASYMKRQECEKTNWHQFGYNVAMKGQRPDADTLVQECKKVEAKVDWQSLDLGFKEGMGNYCKLGTAYNKGRDGEQYNYDFCDSNMIKKLQAKFEKGREDLCTKDGYKFGSMGKEYKNQCSGEVEKKFLVEFNKGRKKYLRAVIVKNRQEVSNINQQIIMEQNNLISLQSQLNSLNSSRRGNYVTERVYDSRTKTYRSESKWVEDPSLGHEKSSVSYKISTARNKINDLQTRQRNLNDESLRFEQELSTMQ